MARAIAIGGLPIRPCCSTPPGATPPRTATRQSIKPRGWVFLGLLKKQRARRPIDGAFIAISLSDLLLGSDAERAAHAAAIRQRIQELYTQLGVRFPIYLMLTKLDLVPGFMEYFDTLEQGRADSGLGHDLCPGRR